MGGWIALLLAWQIAQVPPLAAAPAVEGGQDTGAGFAMLTLPDMRDRTGGGFPLDLRGIVLIAPAWDMTRLFWERATPEVRETVLRDGVYYRPSAYGNASYPITRALFEDGERYLLALPPSGLLERNMLALSPSGLLERNFFGAGPVPLAGPIRIIHGCEDPDIPFQHSLALLGIVDCRDMRLTLVKDAGHRLSRPQDLALLFSTLSEFL